jgi:hypothetical protein
MNRYLYKQEKDFVSRWLRLLKKIKERFKRMKRILLVSTALIMAASVVVFAQELKFDGYLNIGLGIATTDKEVDGKQEAFFKAFGVDSESNGFRFRFNGSYQNEAKNAGVRFRLQGQRRIDQSGYLSMPYLYGWLGFFDNRMTLTGGLVMDSTWESADWWWADDTGEGLGLLLKGEPLKGLTLGVGVYTISQQSGGRNNALLVRPETGTNSAGIPVYGGESLPNFGTLMLRPEDAKYTFNAAYTMPDLFRFSASYRTKNKAGWTNTRHLDNDDYVYGGREESAYLQTELRLLMVKNLTAVVVGTLDKLEAFYERGNMMFSETLGYRLDNVNFGLNAVQFVYNRTEKSLDPNAGTDNKVSMNPGLLFNPWISYTFGRFVPRLDAVAFLGGQSKMGSGDNQWERRGFINVAKAKDANDDYTTFSIRPSVKFNLDSRISLEIGDMINIDTAEKDGAYADTHVNKKSLFSNVFYADVKFSF